MALRELSTALQHASRPSLCATAARASALRHASSTGVRNAKVQDLEELEQSSFDVNKGFASDWDPLASSRSRKTQLPRSRYQYRPPKYYRGPLHPYQPPKPSDPASREFTPGPFSNPRLKQTYQSTVESDLMILSYQHYPPGYEPPTKGERLRSWDDSSPYHKNRPLRPPRGGDPLRMVKKPITFRNVPELEAITVHSFVADARDGSAALHVAGMALQAVTGVRAQSHAARHNVVQWGVRAGKYMSLTCEVKGDAAYDLLSKTVDVVLPRIKDWRGIKGTSGDSSGNIAFGLEPEHVSYFPEIQVNYDSYPSKLIPGCHIILKTTARNDRDARLLCTALGLPVYGKQVN